MKRVLTWWLIGARLACLVNASVTVCGDNAIYAFGGFDQYTDEGMYFPLLICVIAAVCRFLVGCGDLFVNLLLNSV